MALRAVREKFDANTNVDRRRTRRFLASPHGKRKDSILRSGWACLPIFAQNCTSWATWPQPVAAAGGLRLSQEGSQLPPYGPVGCAYIVIDVPLDSQGSLGRPMSPQAPLAQHWLGRDDAICGLCIITLSELLWVAGWELERGRESPTDPDTRRCKCRVRSDSALPADASVSAQIWARRTWAKWYALARALGDMSSKFQPLYAKEDCHVDVLRASLKWMKSSGAEEIRDSLSFAMVLMPFGRERLDFLPFAGTFGMI
jgi:hypothetical protein